MEYKVNELSKLSGVSVRTLHWYDEIGLLEPAYTGANDYRYYGKEELLSLSLPEIGLFSDRKGP